MHARETAPNAHARRIAGEDAGGHGIDKRIAGLGAEAAAGEIRERFVLSPAAWDERFQHDPQAPGQAHQLR